MYYNIGAYGRHNREHLPDQAIFNCLQIAGILYVLTDTIGALVIGAKFQNAVTLNYFVNTLHFIISPLPSFFWFLYCDCKVYNGKGLQKRLKIYTIPIIINTIFVSLTPYTGWTFSIDSANMYHRGAYMWVTWFIAYGFILGSYLLLIVNTANKPRLQLKGFNIFYYLFQIPPVVMGAMQIVFYGTLLTSLGIVISVFIVYINIQNRRLTDIAIERLEHKLMQSQIATMLSQIQPHFLYNSLTAIKKLCTADPKAAEEAVVEFSNYLRGNMDSLTEKGLIPFERERAHIEAYLNLEKAVYGNKINVIYDIEASYFMIPSLTVQPIVENAVKHGICQRLGGGTITVSVKETKTEYLITVTDDGVGFDAANANLHIGIANVRSRLAAMCGGTLNIESKQGVGTTAAIRIPREGAYNK